MERAPDRLSEATHLVGWEHSTTRVGMREHLNDEHEVSGFSENPLRMIQLHLECHLRKAFEDGSMAAP